MNCGVLNKLKSKLILYKYNIKININIYNRTNLKILKSSKIFINLFKIDKISKTDILINNDNPTGYNDKISIKIEIINIQ